MPLVRPPFPEVIDSTRRSDFVSCNKKFQYAHLEHLRLHASNVHLHFGGCFAKGLEMMRKSFWGEGPHRGNANEALAAGARAILLAWGDFSVEIETTKTLENCLDALLAFVEKYPLERDPVVPLIIRGQPAVEFSFALPIPGVRHPESGGPILYAGRFDMLARYGQSPNSVFVNDEKTTMQLGASWANNWRLRAQLTGYVWGAEEYGYPVSGVIIRGISILKTGFGHAFVLETRPHFQVTRYKSQLTREISRMIESWSEGYWDYNLDQTCSSYGGCPYLQLCLAKDPEKFKRNYVVAPWDPLAKH